eukprot:s5682_g1.t1
MQQRARSQVPCTSGRRRALRHLRTPMHRSGYLPVMLVVAVVLLRFPLVPMAFIGGAGDEDASFSRSPPRSPMGAGPQAAVKEKEGEKDQELSGFIEFVQQLDEDEKAQQDQETVGDRRPFWSSLAEQWGLLGLLVGIVVAFTGTGVLDNSMLDRALAAGVASAGSVGDVASFEETAAGVEEAVAAVGGAEAVEA